MTGVDAGGMDQRITIERRVDAGQSPSGMPLEEWRTLVGPIWARVRPVRAGEQMGAPNVHAWAQFEFRIRVSRRTAGVSPKDRIVHRGVVYDILSVPPAGRQLAIDIIAQRHAD